MKFIFLFVIAGMFLTSCIPPNLRKYSKASGRSPISEIDGPVHSDGPARTKTTQPKQQPPVYALDEQTFRFQLSKEDVWDALLDVLMRNYNLTIVDNKSGLVTTEWDSFYLNGKVYRNKVSIRVRSISRRAVDVMVHNNVEKLAQGDSTNYTANANIWLPSDDVAGETGRIAQNLALILRQPPPVMPRGMMATGQKSNEVR